MHPKPSALSVQPEAIPHELTQWPQWVVWRYEWKADKRNKNTGELGAWDKPPYNARTGALASSTTRGTWSSFEDAVAKYHSGDYDGIGFVPSESDPFVCGDFDQYVAAGVVDPKVMAVVHGFASYAEISPSGTGVRLIIKGTLPGGRGRNNREKRAELYDRGHYLTITGHSLNGSVISERQPQLEQLYAALERKLARPDPIIGGDLGLLQRARGAKNGLKFQALYDHGTLDDYGSPSDADMALCCLLAFWTRKDPERMDRLFRESRLMRPKWDEQHGAETYGRMTIGKAIASITQVVAPGAQGHERPTGLSYYSKGRQRIWVVHFPFGDVEVMNEGIPKWSVVEAACHGSEIARLPEYDPSPQEWKAWLRDQMPLGQELPSFPELDERGRVVAAVLRYMGENTNLQPEALLRVGIWNDEQRCVISAATMRNHIDNPYKPWLAPSLLGSVLRGEFDGLPGRLWLPSGSPTKQEGDRTRPHVVVVARDKVQELAG